MLLFLGAGASVPFGIPTTRGFIDLFDKEVGKNDLYGAIKEAFKEDGVDLEVIMTVLDDLSKPRSEIVKTISPHTFRFLLKDRTKIDFYLEDEHAKNEAQNLLVLLQTIITRQCLKAVQESTTRILEVYDALFRAVERKEGDTFITGVEPPLRMPSELRIFTTNYDTCIEKYFNSREVELKYGIVPRFGENFFDADSYPKNGRELFKLHGSVDLYMEGGYIKQRQTFPELSVLTHLGKELGRPLIVYPIESSGYRHVLQSPFLDLSRHFRDCLKEQSLWIVIGSSFRDLALSSTMNDVIATKRRTSEHPRVILLHPHAQVVKDKVTNNGFEILASRIEPVEIAFGKDAFAEELRAILAPK